MDLHRRIVYGMHKEARRLAFAFYLRKGRVPPRIIEILHATASPEAFDDYCKFSPDQPRAPARTPEGGQWIDAGGGGRKPSKKPREPGDLRRAPDKPTEKRAQAIYGETSGLLPQLLNPGKNPYAQENWNSDSARKLHVARVYIGVVAQRNPKVHYAVPTDPANSIESQAWSLSIDAAIEAGNDSVADARITHFFLRQGGVGRQIPPWPELRRYYSMGPFINMGGGDVPQGSNTYIDFYGKKPYKETW